MAALAVGHETRRSPDGDPRTATRGPRSGARPPSNIASTMARSRQPQRHMSASTSAGVKIWATDRGVRIDATPGDSREAGRHPRGTGLAITSPHSTRYEYKPNTDDNRRLIVEPTNRPRHRPVGHPAIADGATLGSDKAQHILGRETSTGGLPTTTE